MKKLLLILCVTAMTFGLVACNHTCELCGKDGASKVKVMGTSGYLCDSCEEYALDLESFANSLQ